MRDIISKFIPSHQLHLDGELSHLVLKHRSTPKVRRFLFTKQCNTVFNTVFFPVFVITNSLYTTFLC